MTQDELWNKKWKEAMNFIQENKRCPSKHYEEERNMHSWMRHSRRLLNTGRLKPERRERFEELMKLANENRHINQWY